LKKFTSIWLLGVLFFNLFGYQLLHVYFEGRAEDQLQRTLDIHGFDEARLISIKIPAKHFPYLNYSVQFEVFNGQIEIHGVVCSYVKRRLCGDSIEMLCIPNQRMAELEKCKNDFFTLVNDLKHLGRDKRSGAHSNHKFTNGYFTIRESMHIEKPSGLAWKKIIYDVSMLPGQLVTDDDPPPEKTV